MMKHWYWDNARKNWPRVVEILKQYWAQQKLAGPCTCQRHDRDRKEEPKPLLTMEM